MNPFLSNEHQTASERVTAIHHRSYIYSLGDMNVHNGLLMQFPDLEVTPTVAVPTEANQPEVARAQVNPAVATTAIATAVAQEARQMSAKEYELAAARQAVRNINEITA